MRIRILLALAVSALTSPAIAQSTAFTYQGNLTSSGAPAAGAHDLRFRLFNAGAPGGVQVGPTLCIDNAAVTGGVFTVQLDFGQQYATAAERHLEIEVRRDTGLNCSNATGFVVLTPRQRLTAAPMASHANAAFALDAADGSPANAVFVDDAGNVGIGTTTPAARLDVRGGPILVENIGDQADLLWLASERSWVFRQEGTGAATALKLQSIGGGGNKHFLVQTDGFVGIGTTSPAAKLDVRGDIKLGGPSGHFSALGGQEELRLVRGNIDGDGTVLAGTGFIVRRFTEGVYDISFTPAFVGQPTVTATADRPGGAQMRWAYVFQASPTGARITISFSSLEPTDSDFSICVIGPR